MAKKRIYPLSDNEQYVSSSSSEDEEHYAAAPSKITTTTTTSSTTIKRIKRKNPLSDNEQYVSSTSSEDEIRAPLINAVEQDMLLSESEEPPTTRKLPQNHRPKPYRHRTYITDKEYATCLEENKRRNLLKTQPNFDIRLNYYDHFLVVKLSGSHRRGAFAITEIDKHRCLGEYYGEIITEDEATIREDLRGANNPLYFWKKTNEKVIDATHSDSKVKYVNHSCLPNAYAAENDDGRLLFFASEIIKEGIEVTIDYEMHREHGKEQIPCNCRNGEACHGYVDYLPPEVN